MRILVVEDERRVASFISRALRENAYAVDVVNTGELALMRPPMDTMTVFSWTCVSPG
jgi:DNA-binding response OmpR family regulator